MQSRHLHGLFARTLRSKPEDAITTVLAELMRSPEVGLHVVRALLGREKETLPTGIDIQWTGPDGSRPDFRLQWPDRVVFIESKFWAPLQGAQRAGYRPVMQAEKVEAQLFFLAPNVRKAEIMSELANVKPVPGFLAWEHVHARLATISLPKSAPEYGSMNYASQSKKRHISCISPPRLRSRISSRCATSASVARWPMD